MFEKILLRTAALISVELIHPGAYRAIGRMIDAPVCAATPAVSDRIAVTTTGKGRDVILIPGLASSAHVWDATVAHLAPHYRVHVVQVSGFAGTPAGANASGPVIDPTVEAIHAYIVAHKLKAPAVVGHSLGGLMAMKLALAHPADVGKVMIVDSLPFFGLVVMGPQATVAAVEPMAARFRDRIAAGRQEDYAAAEPKQMAGLIKSHNPQADAAIAAASASDHGVVARAIYEDFTTDLRPDIARITAPVTMLYPFDPSTGATQAMFDSLYQGAFAPIKQARLKRIDGSYHFIMIDQPAAFEEQIDDFLKG